MPPKKRSYKEAFLNFGFTSVIENSIEKPKCVICFKVLTQKNMKLQPCIILLTTISNITVCML